MSISSKNKNDPQPTPLSGWIVSSIICIVIIIVIFALGLQLFRYYLLSKAI